MAQPGPAFTARYRDGLLRRRERERDRLLEDYRERTQRGEALPPFPQGGSETGEQNGPAPEPTPGLKRA